MALDRVAGLPTWLLSRANARSQEILGTAFAEEGVRGYHYRLLAALAQYGALSQAEMGRCTGSDRKDVAVAVKVDPSLLGGLIVRMGSRQIDTSLKTKLSSLKLALKEVG